MECIILRHLATNFGAEFKIAKKLPIKIKNSTQLKFIKKIRN